MAVVEQRADRVAVAVDDLDGDVVGLLDLERDPRAVQAPVAVGREDVVRRVNCWTTLGAFLSRCATKNAANVAATSTREDDRRPCAVSRAELHERRVGDLGGALGVVGVQRGEREADRAAVADDQRRARARRGRVDALQDAQLLLGERLAAGEGEVRVGRAIGGEAARARPPAPSSKVRSVQSPQSVSAKRASSIGSRPIAAPTISPSRARGPAASRSASPTRAARRRAPARGPARGRGRSAATGEVALEAAVGVVVGLAVAGERDGGRRQAGR